MSEIPRVRDDFDTTENFSPGGKREDSVSLKVGTIQSGSACMEGHVGVGAIYSGNSGCAVGQECLMLSVGYTSGVTRKKDQDGCKSKKVPMMVKGS